MALVTQAEYSRRKGVSRQAVFNAVRQGRVRLVDGLIETDDADPSWDSSAGVKVHSEPSARAIGNGKRPVRAVRATKRTTKGARARQEKERDPALHSIVQSRALKEAFAARLLKLEFEEKSRAMMPSNEVRDAAFSTARRVRDLLMSVPDRMAPVLEQRSTADIHRELSAEMRRVCEEMARWAKL